MMKYDGDETAVVQYSLFSMKVWTHGQTDRLTDRQTDGQPYGRTLSLRGGRI